MCPEKFMAVKSSPRQIPPEVLHSGPCGTHWRFCVISLSGTKGFVVELSSGFVGS
jgi:hypothetical protein